MKKIKDVKLNVDNARTPEQVQRMQKALSEKICPFCPKGLTAIHKEKIIWKNKNWMITRNAFPYEGTKLHMLLIPTKHITKLQEISKSMWQDFGEATNYLIKKKKVDAGALLVRFGDMQKNGQSIEHMHVHIVSGEATQSTPEDKRFSIHGKLGYGFKK